MRSRASGGSTLRLCADLAGVVILAIVVTDLVVSEKTSATPQRPTSDWVVLNGTAPRYELAMRELAALDAVHTVGQHRLGGGRRDTFGWRGADRHLRVEVYWRGAERVDFGAPEDEFATQAQALGAAGDIVAVAEMETKFGPVALFMLRMPDPGRGCLGFIRSFPNERLQISGVSCLGPSPSNDRRMISYALDRLVLASAGVTQPTGLLFANAEIQRASCVPPRKPLVAFAAAPRSKSWMANMGTPKVGAPRLGAPRPDAPRLRGVAPGAMPMRTGEPTHETATPHPHRL
jgi:hypothetical protein